MAQSPPAQDRWGAIATRRVAVEGNAGRHPTIRPQFEAGSSERSGLSLFRYAQLHGNHDRDSLRELSMSDGIKDAWP
jgi:hypothetical protein